MKVELTRDEPMELPPLRRVTVASTARQLRAYVNTIRTSSYLNINVTYADRTCGINFDATEARELLGYLTELVEHLESITR